MEHELVEIDKRKNGIYYTPEKLAKYLAEPLISGRNIRVFDPAYGDGALLLAAESVFIEKNKFNSGLELFGCDIHPVNGLLTHLPEANLVECDFFKFEKDVDSDVILTNPPYIRHQSQNKEIMDGYRERYPELKTVSRAADFWSYFVLKASANHLKPGGNIGGIFPWALIQADYAIDLRKWMSSNFSEIRVLALNNEYFENAQERVVLVWLRGYKKTQKTSIEIGVADNIEGEVSYNELSISEWTDRKVILAGETRISELLRDLVEKVGFQFLETYAKIKIGIVTGANHFFVKKEEEALNLGFQTGQLKPILSGAKELPEFINNGTNSLKRLISILPEEDENHRDYLSSGIEKSVHQGRHCSRRNPWFSLIPTDLPDAFLPYRVSKIPFMLLNDQGVYCTNSIHQVFFKKRLSKTQKMWLVVSLLSIYSQLSLEVIAKTYGRGMLKLEPGALKKALVIVKKDPSVKKTYNLIMKCLGNNDKEKAVEHATNYINSKLSIPDAIYRNYLSAWGEIQKNRER